MSEKKVIIIAGPNGAGKTTFARSFLPAEARCPHFINADLIAAGLSPFAPEAAALRAGRLMLREMDACEKRGVSFAIETTLAGLNYLARIHSVACGRIPDRALFPDSARCGDRHRACCRAGAPGWTSHTRCGDPTPV